MRAHLGALWVALGAAALLHPTGARADDITWYPCSSVTLDIELSSSDSPTLDAECALIKAPLCYDGICKASGNTTQIDVFVKRIAARSSSSSEISNVWFLQGGPGSASPAMESAMKTLYSLFRGAINVYTMDHRGTGRSTKLDCVAAQALTSASPFGTTLAPSEVANCAADIATQYGSDMSAFSVTSAASDVHNFIENFQPDGPTFVYGVSYGTSVVERLMHLNSTKIAGYVLDGISTTSGAPEANFEYFSRWDADYGEVGEYFLSACSQFPTDCGNYFKKSSLSATLRSVMADFDASKTKCADVLTTTKASFVDTTAAPGDSLRTILGSLLADESSRVLIPVLAYRLDRCNSDDVKAFRHFLQVMDSLSSSSAEEESYSSDLLYRVIVYSEFWESPAPSYETLLTRFRNVSCASATQKEASTYCAMTKESSDACKAYTKYASYKAPALVYKKDAYWNVAAQVPNNASVLLMSSRMDPQTPHKYAQRLYNALQAKSKKLVTFETATHGTLWSTSMGDSSTTCGMRILSSYVSNGGDLSLLSTSCVAAMPVLDLSVGYSLAAQVFNTTDPFDGKFVGVDTSSDSASANKNYRTTFFILIPIIALIILLTTYFYVKWRRARRHAIPVASTPMYQSAV